ALLVPALTLATLLAWLQAVAWSPFPVPWFRPVVIILFAVAEAVAATAVSVGKVHVTVFAGGGVLLLVAAFAVGRSGVARARRGEGATNRSLARFVQAVAQ